MVEIKYPPHKIFKTSPEGIEVHKKFMEKENLALAKMSKDKEISELFQKKK